MRLLLAFFLGIGVVCSAACQSHGAAERAAETVTLSIRGMTCPVECPPKVQLALSRVPGVQTAAVDFNANTATVTCTRCDQAAMEAALEQAGFGLAKK